MQEFVMELDGWDGFLRQWESALREIPGLKGQVLEASGDRLLEALRPAIDRSGLKDSRGRVKKWQSRHVGSGKGYVAVRADSVEVKAGNGDRQTANAGALTNYLTSGHRVRPPSGRSARYVSKARMSRAPAYGFYAATAGEAQRLAAETGEAIVDKVLEVLR